MAMYPRSTKTSLWVCSVRGGWTFHLFVELFSARLDDHTGFVGTTVSNCTRKNKKPLAARAHRQGLSCGFHHEDKKSISHRMKKRKKGGREVELHM